MKLNADFVGLNPEFLNLSTKSAFNFIVLYNNSKLFVYYIGNKSSIKSFQNL